jgi:hypothetical protein
MNFSYFFSKNVVLAEPSNCFAYLKMAKVENKGKDNDALYSGPQK